MSQKTVKFLKDSIFKLKGKNLFTNSSNTTIVISEWNTDKDGNGDKYSLNQEITGTKDLTLYAQWGKTKNYGNKTYDPIDEIIGV